MSRRGIYSLIAKRIASGVCEVGGVWGVVLYIFLFLPLVRSNGSDVPLDRRRRSEPWPCEPRNWGH